MPCYTAESSKRVAPITARLPLPPPLLARDASEAFFIFGAVLGIMYPYTSLCVYIYTHTYIYIYKCISVYIYRERHKQFDIYAQIQ